MLKLSIITPSYNHGLFLEQAILSVIHQDYANIEYILIDGASTDNSVDIIRKYEKHIAYWVSEPDQDLRYALEKGFARASGDIVAWQNADDYYEPNVFGRVMGLFQEKPDVNLIYGNTNIVDESGLQIDELCNVPINYPLNLFGSLPFQNQSAFFRRNLWEKAGGITFQELNFDIDLIYRLIERAHPFFLRQVLGNYRSHSGSISFSRQNKNLQKDRWLIRKRFMGKWSKLPRQSFLLLEIVVLIRRYLYLIFQGDLVYVFRHMVRILNRSTATHR